MFQLTFTNFAVLFLFRKTRDFDEFLNVDKLSGAPVDFGRIRCPLCSWQPENSSRWCCSDDLFHRGCLTVWNTFETRGNCPGCAYQWRWTVCLRCHQISLHKDWYEEK